MKKEVEFKSVVAAAIIKFGKLDNVDINMLFEDLESLSIDVTNCYYLDETRRFVEIQEDGSITLSGTITLDHFIDERDITVKDELQKMVTEEIRDYFDKLDVEEFKRRKLEFLKSGKEKLLKNANILLISDIEEEYQELVKYGFSNIDYFKSIIRADRYFKEHPEEAEKYDILIDGSERVVDDAFDLDNFLRTIRESEKTLAITLNRYNNYPDYFDLVSYLKDSKNHRYWTSTEREYSKIFDRIVECAVLNKVSDKVKEKEFIPIKDKINPNRLPLPTKKEEVRILYLDACSINPEAEIVASRLGLNVTFLADNSALKESVRYILGNYDIIIASSFYSNKLLSLSRESTEQCKDTGRQLVLLLTYQEEKETRYDNHSNCCFFGYQMELGYSLGGLLSPSFERNREVFQILDNKKSFSASDSNLKQLHERNVCMRAILEGAVELYNKVLEKETESKSFLTGFKTMNQYNIEFLTAIKEFEEEKEKEMAPLRNFDQLISSLSYYLEYRKKGLVPSKVEGIELSETKDTIEVTNMIQGVPYCAMSIRKGNNMTHLKRFKIQTRTKKGRLSDFVEVGVYTKNYEGKDGVPNPLNEEQQRAFTSICKKVEKVIRPLNIGAFNKEREMQKENKEKPKQKSYRRNQRNRRNASRK